MSTNLKGFTSVFQYTLNNDILDGLVEFFDYGLLGKGNYFNVTLGEQSPNGAGLQQVKTRFRTKIFKRSSLGRF